MVGFGGADCISSHSVHCYNGIILSLTINWGLQPSGSDGPAHINK